MGLPCDKSEVINYIKESVDKIDVKLDSVVEFKNKALGMIIAITAIISGVFNLILFLFKN